MRIPPFPQQNHSEIFYYNPENKYASIAVVFGIAERSMSSKITEVNGIILSSKILFKAVLEILQ